MEDFVSWKVKQMWPGLQLSILWKLRQEMFSPGAARFIALPNCCAAD